MTICLFCHFDILAFEFHAIWNTIYKKYLVCYLLMVWEHSFILLFLANFVDGASAYIYIYIYFFFYFLLLFQVSF